MLTYRGRIIAKMRTNVLKFVNNLRSGQIGALYVVFSHDHNILANGAAGQEFVFRYDLGGSIRSKEEQGKNTKGSFHLLRFST